MLFDLVIVFLAASGVILIMWCLIGALLHPVFDENMVTYLPVRGDGADVERSVRAYAWFRSGRVSGGKLILVDLGLDRQGLQRTAAICSRYDWVSCCTDPETENYILPQKGHL